MDLMLHLTDFPKLGQLVREGTTGLKWRVLTLYIMAIHSMYTYIICVMRSKEVAELIKILDRFDRCKFDIMKKIGKECCYRKWHIKPLFRYFIIIFMIILELIIVSPTMATMVENGPPAGNGVFFGILAAWQIMPLLLYLYFIEALKDRFSFINELVPIADHDCNFAALKGVVTDIRSLYVGLANAVKHLSGYFGLFLALNQLRVILMCVANLHVYVFIDNYDLDVMYCLVIHVTVMVTVVYSSHDVSNEVILYL